MRVVVTGASRGIGLELVRQCLAAGDRVVAGCRDPAGAAELAALVHAANGQGVVVRLDVDDPATAEAAAEAAASHLGGVDLLVNNAGIGRAPGFPGAASDGPLGALEQEAVLAVLRTNAVGPVVMTRAVEPLLERDAVVLNVSSGLGSISGTASGGGWDAYAMSKAALNMFTRLAAAELRGRGVVVLAVSPGWVRTDMGGAGASLSPAESVAGLRRLAATAGPADSGRVVDHLGGDLSW